MNRYLHKTPQKPQLGDYLSCMKFHCLHPWRSRKTFDYGDASFRYFSHPYNRTWKSERAVEVPIAASLLAQYRGKRVLEFGNVLSHYLSCEHVILDKYERGKRVINEDIVDFRPAHQFDLILSISTLEHVGWDEQPRQPMKLQDALTSLKNLVTPGGVLFITMPLGWSSFLDELLVTDPAVFGRLTFMKRFALAAGWDKTTASEALACAYGQPFPNANAIAIGRWQAAPVAAGS